ncbi:ABC transporter ATP-binding protein [Photobacterium profundum]|uniref:ABC transporter ATP-binding protein n=1 Tax=Photobacterium profundum TaxID=74109 RepID=UPI003D0E0374
MNYVEVSNLSKRFGQNTVFEGIKLTIKQGEFVTLLGPSGCGKSTLLRCIAGLNDVDNGNIIVKGEDITHAAPQTRGIGMVFQSYALFPNMTVWDNIAFGLKMQKVSAADLKQQVGKVIELVELNGREQYYPHQLSGGQRQRVALARALVVKPRILLLDEPLSALDARIRKHLREQIRTIQKEMNLTTIFVTHDQEEALTMSDRIFLMNKGEIVQSGTAEEIYTQPASEFVASFMGNYNLLGAKQVHDIFGMSINGKLAIRPESIYVREAGRQYGEHISAPVLANVVSHQLLGNVIRYQVVLSQDETQQPNVAPTPSIIVDMLNRSSERLFEQGTKLELMFNKNEMQEVA